MIEKMIQHLLIVITFFVTTSTIAQVPFNAAAPNGYTKKASVSEQVGLAGIRIDYHRPAVNGRDGKIWGGVVHIGFKDQGFGNRKPSPWRAGANENTVIEFDSDVQVEGKPLQKGRYGLFISYGTNESTVIFSKRYNAWGSFFYDDKEDALRVIVRPQPLDKSVENLKYEFVQQTTNSAIIVLSWERLSIPFKIEVDYLRQQFNAFLSESQNPYGFTSQGLNIAASWALQHSYELQTALEWATTATSTTFPGDPTSFLALSTKFAILDKLGRSEEAASTLKTALPFGNINQLQQLGRELLAAQKIKAAMEVFQYNYDKNPNQFITLAGMTRGLSANADYKKALEFANKALPLAPNQANKEALLAMIEKLKAGKDVN